MIKINTPVVVALISAGSSIITVLIIKPFVDKQLLQIQLKLTYRAEQTKKINDVIAKYKGRLLKSAELLNKRLKNYARNYEKNWLSVNGDYTNEHHYLDSTVYRFLSFYAYIKIIESNLIYFDATISKDSNLRLIKYFRVFEDVMCDVDLYKGHTYDNSHDTEHFFANLFQNYYCNLIVDDNVISFEKFCEIKPTILSKIKPVFEYFDGIKPVPMSLKCERLKIFHLLLIALLNEFGYDFQITPETKYSYLQSQLKNYRLVRNFKELIEKYKLIKIFGDPISSVIDKFN